MNNCGKKSKEKSHRNNFLRNKRSFILVSILCMGIGFAFLSTNLTIIGNTLVSGNKWKIYFDNVQVNEGSVDASVVPTTVGTTTTSLEYTISLDKPGDYYEFTVDAINDGTIDAMIDVVYMTKIDADAAKYLSYTATYLNGTALSQYDILAKKSTSTYKIRVEYRPDITASDLSEEAINLNLSFGVNYVQVAFEQPPAVNSNFLQLVRNSAQSDSGIDFTEMSSEENGQGLYLMSNTQNNSNPIYYYRGAVENNNAKFAGYCWKIVRTTETGGTKLVYNGEPTAVYSGVQRIGEDSYLNVTNDETNLYTFDSTEKKWTNDTTGTLSFTVKEAGDYYFNIEDDLNDDYYYYGSRAIISIDGDVIYRSPNRRWGNISPILLENLTPSSVISFMYISEYGNGVSISLDKAIGTKSMQCISTTTNIGESSFFPDNINGIPGTGYMYGTTYYQSDSKEIKTNYLFGNSFIYSNGVYTLTDTKEGVDSNHHYTCFNATGTCSAISYVFESYQGCGTYWQDVYDEETGRYKYVCYGNNIINSGNYITLMGGKGIEDMLLEIHTNNNNSEVKRYMENWFNGGFNTYFLNRNKDYNNYLEDTVWCSDKSINTIDVDGTGKYTSSRFNPNGGGLAEDSYLYYSAYGRVLAGTPSLTCVNRSDSYTVKSSEKGNGLLDYPIGLLTVDEIVLAGGKLNDDGDAIENDFYLNTGDYSLLTMSPSKFDGYSAEVFALANNQLENYFTSGQVRPSISLKYDVEVAIGGDGTAENPYEFLVD